MRKKMLHPDDELLFEESLRSANPIAALGDALRRLHKESGKDREQILTELDEFRDVLHKQNRGADEEIVLEVMHFLVGWSSPHLSLAKAIPSRKGSRQKDRAGAAARRTNIPNPAIQVKSLGTFGILVDQHQAAFLRDSWFRPTAFTGPTTVILDLRGIFASVGFLRDLILPLGQAIKGGAYAHPIELVVITYDPSAAEFISGLAKTHGLPLYVEQPQEYTLPPLNALYAAHPVGDLTSTERTTLNVVIELGGTVTASQLAREVGIEPTAAGNRLKTIAEKGFLYLFTQPQREGHVYIHPGSYGSPSSD